MQDFEKNVIETEVIVLTIFDFAQDSDLITLFSNHFAGLSTSVVEPEP